MGRADEWLDQMEATTRTYYFHARGKEINPVLRLRLKNGDEGLAFLLWGSAEEKEECAKQVYKEFGGKVEAFLFAAEGWRLALKGEDENAKDEVLAHLHEIYGSISAMPQRREILLLHYKDAEGSRNRVFLIQRDEDGYVTTLVPEPYEEGRIEDRLWDRLIEGEALR